MLGMGLTRALCLLFMATATLAAKAADAPALDYHGTYAGEAGSTLEIVAGPVVFAVIDEAKYTLTRVAADRFVARSGDEVEFTRDASGAVTGYRLRGQAFARLSAVVSKASADLAWPRPALAPNNAPAAYRYAAPTDLADGITSGDAGSSGLNRAVLERVVQGVLDGTWPDVHSVLVHHRGHLILEEYFYGYSAPRVHQMRSATKSVVGALAGIAAARPGGAQASSPVLARLPYDTYANPDPRRAQITLEHLLSMRTGLACNDYDAQSPGNESKLYEAADWVKATLDLPMRGSPGQEALYCSGAVAVVGRVTERAMGSHLPDFAQETLFGPLGIQRSDWRWNYELSSKNREYSQIYLRPRDLLKFGLLYAQAGLWAGKQIIPAAWVQASLSAQSKIGGTDYGYFWWRPWLNVETAGGPQRVNFHAVQGNGGQKVYLLPQHELVVVFTGGDYNSGASPPNKIMATLILPAVLAAAQAATSPSR